MLVPARSGRDLLEVRERHAADQPLDVGVERARVDERAVDRGRERGVEAAHHDAVDRLGRICRRDGEDGDAAAGGAEPRPQRRHAAPAAVDEADAVRPGDALGEVEHAVATGVHAGHERRPCGERRGGHRRPQPAPRPAREQRAERGQLAGRDPGADEVERRPVEPDHEQRRHCNSASRTWRTVAVSMMSCVVAPQCVQPPASPVARERPATRPTTG